ncbi:MAG: hypothetical protein HKM98_05385 [Gammaproteobacteria bacterium]|nr:hypothetical protein [Gammaproteobacteria bacterium]
MKPLTVTPLFIGMALLFSGCALLSEQISESAEKIGSGIETYCENMPASERPAFRAQVEEACNCTIELTCPE